MNISINVLSLPEEKKTKLREKGFRYFDSLKHPECKEILDDLGTDDILSLHPTPISQSALTIWKNEVACKTIVTFSQSLDNILGGGIFLQSITDICGAPGTGKTQLCLQLCMDVQLPDHMGGLESEALFIDTNHGFSRDRLQDMAESCIEHIKWVQSQTGNEENVPTVDQFLQGVHCYCSPINSLEEFIVMIENLEYVLPTLQKVRLVVIDSFSKPLLLYCQQTIKRTALLYNLLSDLQVWALKFNIAVVITSQLTTVQFPEKTYKVVPGLGEGLSHRINTRVLLGMKSNDASNQRMALLMKSSSRPSSSTVFKIVKSGIRDI